MLFCVDFTLVPYPMCQLSNFNFTARTMHLPSYHCIIPLVSITLAFTSILDEFET